MNLKTLITIFINAILLLFCYPATAGNDGFVYAKNPDDSINKTMLISYEGVKKDIVIPDSVTSIGDDAFSFAGLTSVINPILRCRAFVLHQSEQRRGSTGG